MGTCYGQLNASERAVIGHLLSEGRSLREIGRTLARSVSTISREVRRNGRASKAWPGGYVAERAQALAYRRRDRGRQHKLARQPDLRRLVGDGLAMGWSPEQIAGRLALEHGGTIISHESIYRFIYHRSAQKDPSWHRLLPRAKHRRGRLGRRGGSSVSHIKHRLPLCQRHADAADRRQPGHWEADLMLFSRYGQAVLVTHERASRFTVIARQPGKAAQSVLDNLLARFAGLPARLRRSVTFDNGTEFALHYGLGERLGIDTFFCEPRKPWQKGGIENAIGRLRRPLPTKCDIAALSPQKLRRIAERYNNTPRQCLGFKTPAEVFSSFFKPLHLKRESTSPLSRG